MKNITPVALWAFSLGLAHEVSGTIRFPNSDFGNFADVGFPKCLNPVVPFQLTFNSGTTPFLGGYEIPAVQIWGPR